MNKLLNNLNEKLKEKLFSVKWKRRFTLLVILVLAFVVLYYISFKIGCVITNDVPDGFSITTNTLPASEEYSQHKKDPDEHSRDEETTFLTLAEWYTVFSYQEYAEFISHNKPSSFPYFRAITQYWNSYCNGYTATKGNYNTNYGYHTMLVVIGTSFTVEYGLKGIYENTVGRITEFSSWQTDEDKYIAQLHTRFGNWVPTDPFYTFPYEKELIGLWSDVDFFGVPFIRKLERRIFLSLETSIKGGYGWIIKQLTKAAYGGPDEKVYVTLIADKDDLKDSRIMIVENVSKGKYVVALPHYQGFTDILPELALNGVQFLDFAGNDEIMITLLIPKDWKYTLHGQVLYEMDVLTDKNLKQIAVKVYIKDVHMFLQNLHEAKLVHIFDY